MQDTDGGRRDRLTGRSSGDVGAHGGRDRIRSQTGDRATRSTPHRNRLASQRGWGSLRGGRIGDAGTRTRCRTAQHCRLGCCRRARGRAVVGGHPGRGPHTSRRPATRLEPGPAQSCRSEPATTPSVGGQDGRQGRAPVAAEPALRHRPSGSVGPRHRLRVAAPRAVPRRRVGAGAAPRCPRCVVRARGQGVGGGAVGHHTTGLGWVARAPRRAPGVARRRPGRMWQPAGGRPSPAHGGIARPGAAHPHGRGPGPVRRAARPCAAPAAPRARRTLRGRVGRQLPAVPRCRAGRGSRLDRARRRAAAGRRRA